MKIVAVLMVSFVLAAPGCKDEQVPKPKTAAAQGYVFDIPQVPGTLLSKCVKTLS